MSSKLFWDLLEDPAVDFKHSGGVAGYFDNFIDQVTTKQMSESALFIKKAFL